MTASGMNATMPAAALGPASPAAGKTQCAPSARTAPAGVTGRNNGPLHWPVMGWHGRLDLHYRSEGPRCVVHDRHSGPLRVLQSLYPEGPGVGHNVLLHPPGGIDGSDTRLLDSPLGFAGHRVLATLWIAAGLPLAGPRRDMLLDAAREVLADAALRPSAGVTAPNERVVVLRVLAPRVEPAMGLLGEVWKRWRRLAWDLDACAPRVWRT